MEFLPVVRVVKSVALFFLFIPILLSAQGRADGDSFLLKKHGAHYVFTADINGSAEATVLLESGIHAMLVDSSFVASSGAFPDLKLLPVEDEKMNLAGRLCRITHKADGVVKISEHTSYRGEVYVLAGFSKGYDLAVPVQNLFNDLDDGSRIAHLILENNSLQMMSRASMQDMKEKYSRHEMNTETYLGMPAVRTKLSIACDGRMRVLEANFNIDFGNPELMFLMHQHDDVQKFFNENKDIELRPARNQRGEKIGQLIIAERCQLCDFEFVNAVIAMTEKLPRFTTAGNIGLKFFKPLDAIFDFDADSLFLRSLQSF